MGISFSPSADVAVILNTLIDILERRAQHTARAVKVSLTDLPLPAYFSQTDPAPRLIANDQLSQLEKANLLRLAWLPGEKGHLLQSVTLKAGEESLYTLLKREPASTVRARLEALLLAEQFRFPKNDWQTHIIHRTLTQLRAGKSPTPFSLTDFNLESRPANRFISLIHPRSGNSLPRLQRTHLQRQQAL